MKRNHIIEEIIEKIKHTNKTQKELNETLVHLKEANEILEMYIKLVQNEIEINAKIE